MTNFPKILIMKNNEVLSLILGTKHYTFAGERVDEIFDKAMKFKSNPTEDTLQALEVSITPILRKDIAKYFTTDGTQVYLGQTNIPVPEKLFDIVNAFIEKDYPIESFVNFWRFSMTNPNTNARDRFFDYCQKYGITITDRGYAVLYKAVNKNLNSKKADLSLAEFVSTEWLKVKRWKKSPKNYSVLRDVNGSYVCYVTTAYTPTLLDTVIGNLQELHDDIENLATESGLSFVPSHKGKHGMDIKLGVPVTMPREQCDSNINNECSYGLHIGSFQYIKSFGSNMDTILACLVNPMDIVALPNYDNSKIRCCRYFPYAIIERDENKNWTELESVIFEDDFIQEEDEELLKMIQLDPKLITQSMVDSYTTNISHREEMYDDEQGEEGWDDDDWDDDDDESYM